MLFYLYKCGCNKNGCLLPGDIKYTTQNEQSPMTALPKILTLLTYGRHQINTKMDKESKQWG